MYFYNELIGTFKTKKYSEVQKMRQPAPVSPMHDEDKSTGLPWNFWAGYIRATPQTIKGFEDFMSK